MPDLKRRWHNFSAASRLIVVAAAVGMLVFAGLIFFLQAQNKPATGAVAQVETPAPTIAVAPTPDSFNYVIQPNATLTPLPKNEAARLLALANRFLADGEAVDAAAQYRLILTEYPKSAEATEAAFGLAQAAVARGRWQEANTLYSKFLNDYPNNPRQKLILFALGDVQKALGNWNEAISYYQKYLQVKDSKFLEGYAYFEIAEALNNTPQKSQSLEYYKKAGSSPNASNLLRVTALEKVGDYYTAAGDPNTAADWYNKLLDIAKMPDYRAGVLLKMAKAYAAGKQEGQANTVYNIIVDQYLETPAGLVALKALLAANPTVTSDFHKGYVAYQAGDWDEASKAFGKLLGRSDEKAAPSSTPALATNLSQPEQEKLAKAWFWLGRAYEQKGDVTRAANEYRELQIRLPKTEIAQEAIWRVAIILRNANQIEPTLAQYNYIITTYPAGRYTEQSYYNQASLLLSKNGPEAAQTVIYSFADKFPASDLRNEVLYNLYRAFEAKGNKEAARKALEKAASSTDVDYYAIRASEILAGKNPLTIVRSNPLSHPAAYDPVRFAKEAEADRKMMESWLLTWNTPANPGVTAAPGSSPNLLDSTYQVIRSDAGLKRLAELRLLNREAQASREAKEALDRYAGKPVALYLLALNMNEQNEYYYSLSAARDLLALFHEQKPEAGLKATPLMLQKLLYPLDYQNLVLEQARRNNLDPLLLLSLIKQESAFDNGATSSVGAKGLTQVMPETGRGIATNLDKPNFSPDDLYSPALSLEFGAYYLGRRLQDYKDSPYPALAAYNGGAGNVDRWLAGSPIERGFDNFVENIDFRETRNYVKIIYTSYTMYRQIYAIS